MAEWAQYNGLIVPERVTLAKKMEEEAQKQAARGKFFSQYSQARDMAGTGYHKPNSSIQFDLLRLSREKSLIDKIIIMARVAQVKYLSKKVVVPGKQVGYRVVNENHADPNYSPTEDVIRRCKEVEKIIENVNPMIHPNGFIDFAAVCTDQELTYDRKAMVITKDRTGAPCSYHLVDGTTIRPVIEVLMDFAKKNKTTRSASYEGIFKTYGLDVTNAAYVQVIDALPVACWTAEEMSVNITNPSVEIDRWAYGAGSALEQSIMATQTWLNAWAYNDGLFNQDSPESMLFLYGDVDPIGLGAFQRQVLDQSGSGDYQRVPVIPADENFKAELIKIRELPKDVQFAEFLRIIIQLKTAAFRAHPSIVNFTIDKGSSGGMSIGNGANEDEILSDAKQEGLESIIFGHASWLTKVVIKPRYDDLVMIYDTDLADEDRRIELISKQLKAGMTFNESRRSMGLEGDLEFGDVPDSTVYMSAMSASLAQEQATAEQDAGGGDPKSSKGQGKDGASKAVGKEGKDSKPTAQDKKKAATPEKKPSDNALKKNEGAKILLFEILDDE